MRSRGYESGDLLTYTQKEVWNPKTYNYDPIDPITTAQLPHSCDEWVIGVHENVKALIKDLEAWLEANPTAPSAG